MMRKFYIPFAMAIIAMTGLSQTASADDVIVRHHTKTGQEEVLKVDHKQLPELEKAIRESKSLERFKAPMRDPAGGQEQPEGFAVRFAVEEEEGSEGMVYYPWKVYVCKGNGEYDRDYYNYSYYPDDEIIAQGYAWGCYVPEGEYTVILCSELRKPAAEGEEMGEFVTTSYVVKENVKIEGETKITFKQSEAKNLITATMILPDGSEAPGNNYIYDETGTIVGRRENLWVGASRSFININGDYSLNLGNFEGKLDLVYINDISSNWVYAINMAMVDENGAYAACVTKRGPITSSCEFRNDPSNYSYTTVRFNPKLPGVNDECKGYGISTKIAWKGADWNLGIGGMILNKLGVADEIPVYIDASASDFASPDAIDLITSISVAADVTKIISTDENGNPFLDDNGEPYFYYECSTISGPGLYREEGNKYMCVGDYGYDIAEYPDESFLLPYDEFFSYEKNAQTMFFSGVPVMSTMVDNFILEGYSRFGVYPTFYYPCLSSYMLPYSFTASYNGDTFVENGTTADFDWFEWSLDNYKSPGIFDIVVTSNWDATDSMAILENKIHTDTSKEDYSSPSVQCWQIRDSEGNLSNIASDGSVIYLMCMEDNDSDFDIMAGVSELPEFTFDAEKVREDPFYEAGKWQIRQVYKLSLEDFPGEVGKKYSLVFNLKDASGNTCEQTIGHAFEWTKPTGVEGIDAESGIFIENGCLYAPAGSEVYTIDGRKADADRLSTGLYIVKSGTETVKVLAK